MASPVTELGSHLGAIVVTAGVSVAVAGVVAWGAAISWGKTKRGRAAIFGVVGTAGILLALLIAQLRLRSIS